MSRREGILISYGLSCFLCGVICGFGGEVVAAAIFFVSAMWFFTCAMDAV